MITVAEGPNQVVEKKSTYIYRLNFECLADNIDEADVCFQKEAQLFYGPKKLLGKLCPLISVEIVRPPKSRLHGMFEIRDPETAR
jgi:hypothetical protein